MIDTAPLTLDDIVGEMARASAGGLDVARVHSGDPSFYGAIAEQMRRLDDLGMSGATIPMCSGPKSPAQNKPGPACDSRAGL